MKVHEKPAAADEQASVMLIDNALASGETGSRLAPIAIPAEIPAEWHDFRETLSPFEKVYPVTSWQSWERREDYKSLGEKL